MRFEATVEKGKIAISTPSKWKDYLLGFPDGTKMALDIDWKKNKRSLSQNAFYWLYLFCMFMFFSSLFLTILLLIT